MTPPMPPRPRAPVDRLTRPLHRFLHTESASGVVLLACTAAALLVVNLGGEAAYTAFWKTPCEVRVGGFVLAESLLHVVNDGLMTLFFFVVGLEIKRELVAGELRDPRKAALPVAAALGGMLVPAAIYFALQRGTPAERGWGVPMATDIAFVVGVMALLGPRVPFGLKILLLSLAIADDIGAILVIAAFYSADLSYPMLGVAAGGFAVTAVLNRAGVRAVSVYVLVGVGIWLAVLKSGVHPTVAGVLLGLLTPASAWFGDDTLEDVLRAAAARFAGGGDHDRKETLGQVAYSAREGVSPLERLEAGLHPWVSFVIMPVFALANAGVKVDVGALTGGGSLAVAAGLVVGKPVGVVVFSWLAVRLGLGRLPTGVTWPVLAGGGCLAGIGFTMSLFVAGLAFGGNGESLAAAKVGTLAGSVVSATLGATVLVVLLRPRDGA